MKIFHLVGTDQEWGGLERCVVDLATAQARAGHEVCLGASPRVLERVGPGVGKVELRLSQSRRDPRLLWSVLRKIRGFRPDVVHAQANKAASLIRTLRPFLGACARVATVHNTKRSVRVFSGFDRVIAVSGRVGAALGAIPHEVMWNAIPRSETVPSQPAAPLPFRDGPRPVLAAVGRLVEAKGFDVLLDALCEVDAALWIIGEGPLRAELEARAARLGLADRVWFAGFRRDVAALNARADLMVISSRHEGFPIAFIEMLHQRRPVVSTRVAGVEDMLPEEWLCPCEDAPALAAVIRKALALGPGREQAFAAVFERAGRELALETALPRIHAVYVAARATRGLAVL